MFRGLSVGVYTTNSADAVAYVINSSESNVCVVENDAQLKKVLDMWDEMPSLKAVVQYSGKVTTDKENVYSVSTECRPAGYRCGGNGNAKLRRIALL